ncbi:MULTISPECIES: MarR family transcriptional regulator [Rhizobium/Agrobacterium group]|uniref:MarR family transcriptional regulator n=2 Tax=Neorhizobium TaxID=1525371 RepID=A0ABV0M853_9HYPH|nr:MULTISPECIES: MarR family transcriptional regulator [Rhizobium/Agrobacterium group]KGD94483.1 MarR family transcriptional regulator [Rhizobium sp. YS-1r]MCC2610017.1 MarR family transcriptional regulator [Neorhizobium petrolearium]WGI70195.1 MarR family transcriptional regulator [Neorhizobium petrolearium]
MNKNQSLPWDHPRFRSWIAVARACQLMQSVLTRELASLDIKPPHLDVLVNLYRFEGISQQELARKLLVGRSNMSMTLPQMEKRGLIERRGDANDKRVLRLYLTPEGRHVAEEAMAIQTALIERTLSATPIEQCHAMAQSMEKIILALQAENVEETESA